MNKFMWIIIILFAAFMPACGGNSSSNSSPGIEVAFSDVPFQTEKYLRIGYTLKTWEYEKDNLELQQISVIDKTTGEELMVIDKNSLPLIYRDPLAANQFITFDELDAYYLSIQLPIPLSQTPPRTVSHIFVFKNTIDNTLVTHRGGTFSPRLSETPIVIASPLKRHNLVFENQSKLGYHFNNTLFTQGQIFTSERYAFDSIELNDDFTNNGDGDTSVNTSYFNYDSPLLAVADGTVVYKQDGLPENHGDAKDVILHSILEYGGNFVVLDIGDGHYAFYCHCIPGSITVDAGDIVHEGDEIARLGNSGNSTGPHLHFQITDGPDIFFSQGVPFVLKEYTRTGDVYATPPGQTHQYITNSMMEEFTIFNVD